MNSTVIRKYIMKANEIDKGIIKRFVFLELDIMIKNSGKSYNDLVELFKKDVEFSKHVVKKAVEMAKETLKKVDE